MANPYHHAVSSTRKWGGTVEDYLPIHHWFDESKAFHADFRHRAMRHHAEGIFLCETIFGTTITLSTCAKCSRTQDEHDEYVCPGHESTAGPIGNVVYCDDDSCGCPGFKEKLIPVRWVGEQHVQEDLGFIPPVTMWLERIAAEPWMNRSRKLSRELEVEEVAAASHS